LNLLGSEDPPDYRQNFQAAVTLGLEEHPLYAADLLFSEEIFPVCTPAFLAMQPRVATLAGLMEAPLLDLRASHWKARLWQPVDWAFWLGQFQLNAARCRRLMNFSHYTLLMDAVRDDLGGGPGLAPSGTATTETGNGSASFDGNLPRSGPAALFRLSPRLGSPKYPNQSPKLDAGTGVS